ncbi:phosphate import ATP-binding protein PstB 3 [Clostridia bacterium]|nr:phosphate import ATP-binding protein PstB 3 [Clostridia bacterium]
MLLNRNKIQNAKAPPEKNGRARAGTSAKAASGADGVRDTGVFGEPRDAAVGLEIQEANVYYGEFHAIKGVTMRVAPNEITALIGPSGCGKSTLLKAVNRMNDLIEGCKITGEFVINGKNIYTDVDVSDLRRAVGMVFQKPNPFPMSIYDNIAFGPRIHGVRKKQELNDIVERSLKMSAMWDETKDRLHKSALGLSGGQQQRLCIARALAVEPKILLMDEPTSALDPISTGKIEELCEELKREITIIIVTHNMQQAARISDKTGFFLLGDLVEYDDSDTIFSHPKHEQTRNYISGRFG